MRIKLSVSLSGVVLNLKRNIVWGAIAMLLAGFGPAGQASAAMVQQSELNPADGVSGDRFGGAAALSDDGNTVLIAASEKTVGGKAKQGAVYVYERTNGVWSQQAELTASDGAANDQFGWLHAVALSGDGKTALIGAATDGINGSAYVFVRSANGGWTQQAKLTGIGYQFGVDVALSQDGNTAIIGANNYNSGCGSALIYKRTGAVWMYQTMLTPSDGAPVDFFGNSVALSGDGNTALVGAYHKTIGGNTAQGAAYLYIWSGSAWSEVQRLTHAAASANDRFGSSVALSGDGSVAVVGIPNSDSISAANTGQAIVYTWNGSLWLGNDVLQCANAEFYCGTAASISRDGNTILLYVPGYFTRQGAAYLYRWDGAGWVWQPILSGLNATASEQSDLYGLALSGDGTTAFLGADRKNFSEGAGYMFVSLVNITPSANPITGGTIVCSPNPVQAHSDSICTITPTNDFSSSAFNYISDVQIALSFFSIWTSEGPTSKYTFSDISFPYNIKATFAQTAIWLYRKNMFPESWQWLSTEDTLSGALLHIMTTHPDTNTVRIPSGAYAETGGVLCFETIDTILSGGWVSATSRDVSSPMSTIAGPFTIRNLCSLTIDGITVE